MNNRTIRSWLQKSELLSTKSCLNFPAKNWQYKLTEEEGFTVCQCSDNLIFGSFSNGLEHLAFHIRTIFSTSESLFKILFILSTSQVYGLILERIFVLDLDSKVEADSNFFFLFCFILLF